MKKIQTVGIIKKDNQILLGMKKRGFGSGRWNGFGGKANLGETPKEAMVREFFEETSIQVADLSECGVIEFETVEDENIIECHFFEITKWQGEPKESEEMRPEWFDIDSIPYEFMWPDDKFWLPLFLEGKKFSGKVLFQDNQIMIRNTISAV